MSDTPTEATVTEATEYGLRLPSGKTQRGTLTWTSGRRVGYLQFPGRTSIECVLDKTTGAPTAAAVSRINDDIAQDHRAQLARIDAMTDEAPTPYLVARRVMTITDPWSTVPDQTLSIDHGF